VKAFQEICRAIIVFRESPSSQTAIDSALARCAQHGGHERISDDEARRIHGHIATLKNAAVRLKAVTVKAADTA
jgi:hypothetical protein